ncbi:Asp23/Gls24 family envelope stress response protein [Nocardioides korecus]
MTEKSVEKATTGNQLVGNDGRTTIADTVVSKIAGIAAREVSGVYALGGGASRAVGALRERIPGSSSNHSQGVSVEVGERQAAVDVTLVAEYGVSIADLASGIRRNVIASIERMTGLEVTEVNVEVQDVHVESDDRNDESTDSEPRVK